METPGSDRTHRAELRQAPRSSPAHEVLQRAGQEELGESSKSLTVDDFELVRTLGTGTFARVWLARLKETEEENKDQLYALKVLRKAEDVAGHPFITTLITTFSDYDSLYMLLDYCPGGEIFSYLRKAKRFDENVARFYAAEMVLILEFLHEKEGVAYRDLKPENILLDADGHVKLVDFGFAKRIRGRETYTLCGTPEYLAPEVIQSLGHTTAVDWWALGVLIYEFLTGYPPFWHQNPMEIYKQILHKPVTFPLNPPISNAAKDIILGLCTVDRSHRLGNMIGGSQRVKDHPFFAGVRWDDVYNKKYRGPIIPPLRFRGDTQCFDTYPDEEDRVEYTEDMREWWDEAFEEF